MLTLASEYLNPTACPVLRPIRPYKLGPTLCLPSFSQTWHCLHLVSKTCNKIQVLQKVNKGVENIKQIIPSFLSRHFQQGYPFYWFVWKSMNNRNENESQNLRKTINILGNENSTIKYKVSSPWKGYKNNLWVLNENMLEIKS